MSQIRETLRLRFDLGIQSVRQIATAVGTGKSSVGNYLRDAATLGISSFAQVATLSERDLEELFDSSKLNRRGGAGPISNQESLRLQATLPDFGILHDELRGPGVTLMLLWNEYRLAHPKGYGYFQFREYYQRWKKKLSVVMRQTHRPGEKGFTDFSGDRFSITDPRTGEIRQVEFFIAVMGASNYTFACAVETQTLPDWVDCHRRFFEFIQGVPLIVVPDNLRSAITKADRYEATVNPTFQQMAEHYKTSIIPARPRKPKDKAKAENGVLQAQRWILAVLRHRTFYSLVELNVAISECLKKLNNKPMRGYGKSRQELFELIDRPALSALPREPYEFADWMRVGLGVDYHFKFDDHFYSAPYTLYEETLWIRGSTSNVEIFFKGQRVDSHLRSFIKWQKTTKDDHMPSHHKAHARWTPEVILNWINTIGPATAQGVKLLIERKAHPELAFRSALGIISLAKKHGNARVEKASIKSINIHSFCYQTLKTMLKNRMEAVELNHGVPVITPVAVTPAETDQQLNLWDKNNLRGKGYYH